MRTALALALSLALATPAFLQGRRPPTEPIPTPVSKRNLADFDKLLEGLQGCWQLMELRLPEAETSGRLEVGYMTVGEEFMSIELHMAYFDRSNEMEESYFQSGTHRLSTDNRGFLVTKTLIGSFFDERERLIFEPPGGQRSYIHELDHDRLTLTRTADGARFVFEKLRSGRGFDFYGRKLPEEDKDKGEGGGGDQDGAGGEQRRRER